MFLSDVYQPAISYPNTAQINIHPCPFIFISISKTNHQKYDKGRDNQTTKGLLHLGVTSLTFTTTFIQLQAKNAKISSLNNNMFPLNNHTVHMVDGLCKNFLFLQ